MFCNWLNELYSYNMSCPIKVNSNSIEHTVHNSCYWVLELLCGICLILKTLKLTLKCTFAHHLLFWLVSFTSPTLAHTVPSILHEHLDPSYNLDRVCFRSRMKVRLSDRDIPRMDNWWHRQMVGTLSPNVTHECSFDQWHRLL